jgi:riboflavin kinase/FMN adenylyltransferase
MAAPFVPGASSSEVRRALLAGETGKAAGMLGENYRLGGEVVKGRQLGRTLGFPTANVNAPTDRLVPGKGVYAADAVLPGGETFPAVVNVGVRPTIGDNLSPTVEAHLIGWEGDLYGQTLTLLFADRIRGERRFPSLDALKAQIAADTDAAIKALSGRR